MFLGALLDLGLPIDGLRAALGSLAIEYGSVSAERVLRAGVSATRFRVHEAVGGGRGWYARSVAAAPSTPMRITTRMAMGTTSSTRVMATITRATAVIHRTTNRITA